MTTNKVPKKIVENKQTRVDKNEEKYHSEEELSLTKQQQFNFEANKYEDEMDLTFIDHEKIKKKISKLDIKKELLKTEKLKNRYRKRSTLFLSLFLLMILLLIGLIFLYIKDESKVVVKEKIIQDDNYVFVGDSLTYTYDLEKYYGKDYHFTNSGVDGEVTWGVLSDLENRVYRYNPSKVFLLIGTNDILKGRTMDEILTNIKKIVENIKENRPYCKIYLISLYPVNETDDPKISKNTVANRTNDFIQKINKEYKKIAKDYQINYIDMYSKLLDDEGNLKLEYTKEGLHLVDEGFKVVTKELKKYIKENA